MKEIQFVEKGVAKLVEREIPKLTEYSVLTKTLYTAVSAGTEKANILDKPNTFAYQKWPTEFNQYVLFKKNEVIAETYEEYVIGYLNLPCINGADEGNVFVFMGSLIGWIFSPSIFATKILFFTSGEWLALLVFVGTVFTIGTTLATIAMKKGVSRMLMSLIDWICFYNCILCPVMMCHWKYNEFYSEHLSLIMFTIGLLAARQTIDLQIKICSKQTIEYGIIVMVVNVLLPICYFIENSKVKITIIGLSVIALLTEIATLVMVRSIEILNHLNRRLLFIEVNDSK